MTESAGPRTSHARTSHARALVPFQSPAFARYWWASALSNTGSWMQIVTVPYIIDQLTSSTSWIGLAAFCSLFPVALVAPTAGVWTDRYSRRTVLLAAQGTMSVASLALLLLWASGSAGPVGILACVTVSATGLGFTNICHSAYITELLPPEHLLPGVRLGMTQIFAARAIGPGVAGLLLVTAGPSVAFVANLASFVPLIVVVATNVTRPSSHGEPGRVWSQFRTGLAYTRGRRPLWICTVLMFGFGLLCYSATQLLEPLVRHVFQRSVGEYGVSVATLGTGGLFGALITVGYGDRVRRSRFALAGVATSLLALVTLAVSTYELALPVVFVIGVSSVIGIMGLVTSSQMNTEDIYRGRTTAISNVAFNGGVPLGALAGGLLADLVGLRAMLLSFGLLATVLLAVLLRPFDFLRPLDGTTGGDTSTAIDTLLIE